MDTYDAVVSRLAMLGYVAAYEDQPGINYLICKCKADLLAEINCADLPPGLFCTLVDMVAGTFLHDKLAAGALEIEGLDFSPAAKSITEGDVSVSFAGVSDGTSTDEARFAATLDTMMHPRESILGAYRRLRW